MNTVIYAELEPSRDWNHLYWRLRALSGIYGRLDIPDVPLGKPNISAPVLAVLARTMFRADVIAHLRVRDHNIVSLKSIIKSMVLAGVARHVYLNGDKPKQGDYCGQTMTPEETVAYGARRGAETGLLLSLRKTDSEIMERLAVKADYYYVTRCDFTRNCIGRLEKIAGRAGEMGSRLAVYIVMGTEVNRNYLNTNNIPYTSQDNIVDIIEKLSGITDRIILSAPGDGDFIIWIAEQLAQAGLIQ